MNSVACESCGIALRFARITKVRADKSPGEADTLGRVREIRRFSVSSAFFVKFKALSPITVEKLKN